MGMQYNPDTGTDEWIDDPVTQQTTAPVTTAPVTTQPNNAGALGAGLASLQALGNPLGTTGNNYLAAAGAALPATVATTPDATVATTPDAATGALPAGYGGRPVLTGQGIPLGMMLNPAYGSPALDTREHGYLVGPAHSLDAPQFIEDPNYIPPIEEVPMPEVLAKNGHEVVPIYNTKSTGVRNATQNYGKPIGYYYDNGNSTYVFTDAAGNITGEKARTDEWTSFREGFLKPAAVVVATAYGAPYLSEAMGAGAAAAPTNAALIDSAVGTAGYGVSSATVASGMAGTLGMAAGPLATAVNTAFASGGMEAVREVVSKEGLDLNKILASAGRGAITSGATSLVSNAVNSAGIDVGNTTVNNLINKGLTTATVASIMGGDWKKALVGMGLNEAAGLVAKQIPGFDKLSKEVKSVVTSTIGTGLRGGNMSDATLQNAINMGIKVGVDSSTAWLKDLVPKDAVNDVINALKTAGLQENAGSVPTTTETQAEVPQTPAPGGSTVTPPTQRDITDPTTGETATQYQGADGNWYASADKANAVTGPAPNPNAAPDIVATLLKAGLREDPDNPGYFISPDNKFYNAQGQQVDEHNNVIDPGAVADSSTLDLVTTTGKQDPLIPLEPQTIDHPTGVTPVTVTPPPAPVTPAPVTPAPKTPAPVTPAPVTPAPKTPAPKTPAPVTPSPDQQMYTTTTTSVPTELADINQMDFSGWTMDDLVKYINGAAAPAKKKSTYNPIYAAQGGSIDDLIAYLRR